MHWKYAKIVSITVAHQNTVENPPLDPNTFIPYFSVVPAPATLTRFKQLGWITKSNTGSLSISAEKIVRQDGSSFYRGVPKINESFHFYLKLNRPSVLDITKPFASKVDGRIQPNKAIASFLGRKRLLYMDNLSGQRIQQPNNRYLILLTPGMSVGSSVVGSLDRTPFVRSQPTNTTKIQLTATDPKIEEKSHSFEWTSDMKTVKMDLPEDAWRVRHEPSGKNETLYLSQHPFPQGVFGLIRIFNTEAMPLLNQFCDFRALFARVE